MTVGVERCKWFVRRRHDNESVLLYRPQRLAQRHWAEGVAYIGERETSTGQSAMHGVPDNHRPRGQPSRGRVVGPCAPFAKPTLPSKTVALSPFYSYRTAKAPTDRRNGEAAGPDYRTRLGRVLPLCHR